jgi:hypothetical protein
LVKIAFSEMWHITMGRTVFCLKLLLSLVLRNLAITYTGLEGILNPSQAWMMLQQLHNQIGKLIGKLNKRQLFVIAAGLKLA